MICPNCKTENADDAIHCINCGELLSAENEEDKSSKLEEIKQRRQKKKKRQKRNKIAVISLAAVIVIAAATTAVYWIRNNFLDRTVTDNTLVVSSAPTKAPTEAPTEVPTETPIVTESPMPDAQVSENTNVDSWQSVQTAVPAAAKTAAPTKKEKAVKAAEKAAKQTQKPSSKQTAKPAAKKTAKPAVSSPGFTAGSITTAPVNQGENMSSQLVKASGEAADANGAPLIRLTIGKNVYYAYNNGQFGGGANAYYSLDAAPSANSYDGVPIYNASNVVVYDASGYVLPNSSSKVLTDSDVAHLTKSELILARNEIYARHGRTFKKQELQDYFNSKSWYKVNKNYNYSNDSLNLTATEKANVRFLRHKAE